jgi:hypothetical protein
MTDNALEAFLSRVSSSWGPLTTELVATCRNHLERLLIASAGEPWLTALQADAPASRELCRDAEHGFMLLAHTEPTGLYRPPHDHGQSWVIYAVQQGEIEMGTWARVEDAAGDVRLVKRDATIVRARQSKLFLPGDIHDTRCLAGPALLFRFTERDLRKEDQEHHRLTRYIERNGTWTAGPA